MTRAFSGAAGAVGGALGRSTAARGKPRSRNVPPADEDAVARDGRLSAEVSAALRAVQEDLGSVGREVARLRAREAVLEKALRQEGHAQLS